MGRQDDMQKTAKKGPQTVELKAMPTQTMDAMTTKKPESAMKSAGDAYEEQRDTMFMQQMVSSEAMMPKQGARIEDKKVSRAQKSQTKAEKEDSRIKRQQEHPMEELLVSKRIVQDSPLMKAVKDSICALNTQLSQQLPADQVSFQKAYAETIISYNALIVNCQQYLEKKANAQSPTGKERLDMVSRILENCRNDRDYLDKTASNIYQKTTDDGKQVTWQNIVKDARKEVIDTTQPGVTLESLGAGTSEIQKVTDANGHSVFFKAEEKLEAKTPIQIYTEYIWANHLEADEMMLRLYNIIASKNRFEQDQLNTVIENQRKIYERIFPHAKTEQEKVQAKLQIYSELAVIEKLDCDWFEKMGDTKENQIRLVDLFISMGKERTREEACEDAKIKQGSILSSRNVVTSRVAGILGLSEICAVSKTADLKNGTQIIHGIAMEKAKGEEYGKVAAKCVEQREQMEFDDSYLKQMSGLYLMDLLCFQIDRNQGNYMVQTTLVGGVRHFTSLTAIDNDMSFGTEQTVERSRKEILGLTSGDKKMGVPAIDENLYKRIMSLTPDMLGLLTTDLLSDQEKGALESRLTNMQETLRKFVEQDPTILVKEGESWKDKWKSHLKGREMYFEKGYFATICEELSK